MLSPTAPVLSKVEESAPGGGRPPAPPWPCATRTARCVAGWMSRSSSSTARLLVRGKVTPPLWTPPTTW